MAFKLLPQDVADAFVKQYYTILNKCPENLHKFYHESSFIGWPEPDGDMTTVSTLNGINEKVMSSDYKYCSVDLTTVDAQESSDGAVLVAVTGSLTTQSEARKSFNQVFFLAKQEKGYYVLNDILRCVDMAELETLSNSVSNDGDKNDDCAATSLETLEKPDPEVLVACEAPDQSLDSDFPPIEDTTAKNASTGSLEKAESAPPVSAVKVEAPKVTYASVVARVSPATSPKTLRAASSDDPNQQNALKKSYASIVDGATKALVSSSSVSKAFGSPKKEATTSQTTKNASPNPSAKANADATGIYIGRLPYDITKQGIVDVLAQFGPINRPADTIQIRKHEDGFCCGFVEFETADAARRAVEVHYVMFGHRQAYITIKKSTGNRNNDGRGRSPRRGKPENDRRGGNNNNKGQVGDWCYNSSRRRNRSSSDLW